MAASIRRTSALDAPTDEASTLGVDRDGNVHGERVVMDGKALSSSPESPLGAGARGRERAVRWTPTLVGDLRASRRLTTEETVEAWGKEDVSVKSTRSEESNRGTSSHWNPTSGVGERGTSESSASSSSSFGTALESVREEDDDALLDPLGMTDPAEVTNAATSGWRYHLDDFQLVHVIGRGRYSIVYKAFYRRMNMGVALKCYIRSKLKAHVFEQIAHEMAVHSNLQHPRVAAYYGSFIDPATGNYYLIHELVGRGDVFNALARAGGKFTEERAVETVVKPVIEAIRYLHRNHVLHRDLKPENVLLTDDGSSKLTDFGFSLHLQWYKPLGRLGTTDYMAPEVVRCNKEFRHANFQTEQGGYGKPVDYWAIGCLAYELIVGFPPFQSTSREAIYELITAGKFKVPSFVSEQAADFIGKILVLEPSERMTPNEMLKHPWIVSNVLHEGESLGDSHLRHRGIMGSDSDEIPQLQRAATAAPLFKQTMNSLSSKLAQTTITPQDLLRLQRDLDWQYTGQNMDKMEKGHGPANRSSVAFTASPEVLTEQELTEDIVKSRSFSLSHRLRRFGSSFAFRFRRRD